MNDLPEDHQSRDTKVAAILGLFFVVLAIPVLGGSLSATLAIDRLLSVSAGVLLLLIGGLFLWAGRRWRGSGDL